MARPFFLILVGLNTLATLAATSDTLAAHMMASDWVTGKIRVKLLEADTRQHRTRRSSWLGALAVVSQDWRAGWWPGKPASDRMD